MTMYIVIISGMEMEMICLKFHSYLQEIKKKENQIFQDKFR